MYSFTSPQTPQPAPCKYVLAAAASLEPAGGRCSPNTGDLSVSYKVDGALGHSKQDKVLHVYILRSQELNHPSPLF